MAFLTKGLRIVLKDTRAEMEREKVFHYEGGIREFVTYLNRSKEPLYPNIMYCEGEKETALWWRLLCSIMIPTQRIPMVL